MSYYLQSSDGKIIPFVNNNASNSQEITIGRLPTNNLQIVDQTVSKNHASIVHYKSDNIYVLHDLGTVNGTFVNQQPIHQNQKRKLNHNDKIQFGKHQIVYSFKNSNPQPPKRGKINFKDYHFELQDSKNHQNVVNILPKYKPTQPSLIKTNQFQYSNMEKDHLKIANHQSKLPKQGSINSNIGKTKFERPSGRIKIPNFEQFLQFQEQQNQPSVKNLPITSSDHLRDQQLKVRNFQQHDQQLHPPSKWKKKQGTNQNNANNKVKLPVLKNELSSQQKQLIKLNQRKKQIQQAQFNAHQQMQQNQRKILQQRLKLQIQKSKNQQKLLNQKIVLERQLAEQHNKIEQQKFKIQQQLQEKFQQREQLQKRNQFLYQQKQKQLLQQLQKDKQRQITQLQDQKVEEIKKIQQKQTQQRLLAQRKLKQDLDRKKMQLELQAEAITRQYQTIYKETIKKMKRDVERQQQKINELQNQLQKFEKTQNIIVQSIQQKSLQRDQLKQVYLNINSRNKAFLLYASHLQNKIDQLEKSQKQQNNFSSVLSLAGKARISQSLQQLQEQISASRKLINMKIRQRKGMQAEIRQLVCQISVLSIDNQHYLDTILQNHEQIQSFKQIYYQCMQEQKAIERKWDAQIEEVSDLDNKCKNIRKDIQNNRKKINDDLLDNIKKLTQQRIHMLKMMHYADEDKKRAAKFLVQQMLNLQQDIRNIKIDSQNVHSKITQIILMSQQKKRQNQTLSQILFGNMNNTSSHHFDNMKNQINRLMDMICTQRQTYSIHTFLKASEQVKNLENKIYEEFMRQRNIKQTIKKDASIPAKSLQRNPLVFFGQVLLKKQLQFDSVQSEQKQLEKNVFELKNKVNILQSKKDQLGKLLEKHKIRQLQKARKFLL